MADDPSTNDGAWASWARHMAIATAVAFPVLTVLFATAFQSFSDIDAKGAYAIAAWASFWGCLFVGGAAGTTVYEVRKHET